MACTTKRAGRSVKHIQIQQNIYAYWVRTASQCSRSFGGIKVAGCVVKRIDIWIIGVAGETYMWHLWCLCDCSVNFGFVWCTYLIILIIAQQSCYLQSENDCNLGLKDPSQAYPSIWGYL